MATGYEAQSLARSTVWSFAGLENSFSTTTADVQLATGGPFNTTSARYWQADPTSAPITFTAPSSVYSGYRVQLQNSSASANAITFDGNGYNVNGSPTASFSKAYGGMTVEFNGTQYIIIGQV